MVSPGRLVRRARLQMLHKALPSAIIPHSPRSSADRSFTPPLKSFGRHVNEKETFELPGGPKINCAREATFFGEMIIVYGAKVRGLSRYPRILFNQSFHAVTRTIQIISETLEPVGLMEMYLSLLSVLPKLLNIYL